MRNTINAKKCGTKLPLDIFFIDLEPKPNSKDIYKLKYVLQVKVLFESLRKQQGMPQCRRSQEFVHTVILQNAI